MSSGGPEPGRWQFSVSDRRPAGCGFHAECTGPTDMHMRKGVNGLQEKLHHSTDYCGMM